MASSSEINELSASWELESDYALFRGITSLTVAFVELVLLFSLIIKLAKQSKGNKPEVCKYCAMCGSSSSFECKNVCTLPAPLDVCICLYFLSFLTFLCNGVVIIKYGNWIKAQQEPLGYATLVIFAVFIGFLSLCTYMYFYSMLILTVSAAGDEFRIPRWKRRLHTVLMLSAALMLPAGNIMMEVYGTDYGKLFRIGQQLAYVSFAFVFLGISHLALLLSKKLEMVLVNVMTCDVVTPRHSKTRTQVSRDVERVAKKEEQRDAQLIQVITKLIVITFTILIISTMTGIITGARYYWGENIEVSRYLSLFRWFWFTQINIAFGSFVVYLTIGFNIHLYKYWCRCDSMVHKCVMCCVKRDAIRTVTMRQSIHGMQSPTTDIILSTTVTPMTADAYVASNSTDLTKDIASYSSINSPETKNLELKVNVQPLDLTVVEARD